MKTKLLLIVMLCPAVPSFSQKHGQEKIDSLFAVFKTAKQDSIKVNALNGLAYEFRSNNADTAIYFASEALALATKTNYETGIINAYLYKAIATMNLGKYGEALKNNMNALKVCDELPSSEKATDKSKILKLKAGAYSSIANIYDEQGNYTEALKNNFAALKIREETKDKVGIAASYNNIGNIYAVQGNYPEALKNLFAALKIKEETAKIIGAVVLLAPFKRRIKEWAYVGFAIVFISALIAHLSSGDPASVYIMPVIFLFILLVSYISYLKIGGNATVETHGSEWQSKRHSFQQST